MARHAHPYEALKIVYDAGDSLATAELSYLDITAAGTAQALKAVVADANTAVSGLRRKVVDAPAGAVLNASHVGSVYTNAGASGAASFDLPAAVVGMAFSFYVKAAFGLQVNPNGTQTIGLPSSGAQQAAGKYIEADAVGEYVDILCVTEGQWETLNYRGTWTVEG